MKAVMPCPRRAVAPSALLIVSLALCVPRHAAKAEDAVDFRYENYREEDDRITVVTQSSSVDEDVLATGHIRLTGTIDAVAGATPTGRPAPLGSDQVVLTEIHTRRKAWSGDLSEQLQNFNIDAGFALSRESDYVSRGWSLNTLTDFNEKNTTLRVGVAGTSDRVEVFFEPAYLPKQTNDAIVGITQLIDPLTFVTVNFSAGDSSGYLAEPHKFVEKSIEIFTNIFLQEAFGENSPNRRERETLYASINRAFPGVRGAIEGSYRLYTDSYGIVANTLGLSWIQHVGPRLILEPFGRFYTQTAARFYYYNLDSTSIVPTHFVTESAPYYTSDFRLSAEDAMSYGLKATWITTDRIHLYASYEEYALHGRDGITPASAYPTAGISTLGVKFIW